MILKFLKEAKDKDDVLVAIGVLLWTSATVWVLVSFIKTVMWMRT